MKLFKFYVSLLFVFFILGNLVDSLLLTYVEDPNRTIDNSRYADLTYKNCTRFFSVLVDHATPLTAYRIDGFDFSSYSILTNGTLDYFTLTIKVPSGSGSFQIFASTLTESETLDINYECYETIHPQFTKLGFTKQATSTQFSLLYEFKINNNIAKTLLQFYLSKGSYDGWGFQVSQLSYNTFFLSMYIATGSLSPSNTSLDNFVSLVAGDDSYGENFTITLDYPNIEYSIPDFTCSSPTATTTHVLWCSVNVLKSDPKNLFFLLNINNGAGAVPLFSPAYGTPENSTYISVINLSQTTYLTGDLTIKTYICINQYCANTLSTSSTINQPSIVYPNMTSHNYEGGSPNSNLGGARMMYFNTETLFYLKDINPYILSTTLNGPLVYTPKFYLNDGAFGLSSGTFDHYLSSAIAVVSKYESRPLIDFVFQNINENLGITMAYSTDIKAPILSSLELIPIPGNNRYIILRAAIVDDDSGFSQLIAHMNTPILSLLTSENLVQGSRLDGIYEAVIENSQFNYATFYISDFSSNMNTYGINDPTTDLTKRIVISNPKEYNYNILDFEITSASWSDRVVNATHGSFTTTFRFSVVNPFTEYSPTLTLSKDFYVFLEPTIFYGQWNNSSQQYEIPVTIPMRIFTGVVTFDFYYFKVISSQHISNSFPDSILWVYSEDADMFGPIIDQLEFYPQHSNPITIGSSGQNIGWTFQVSDKLNGFEYGNLTVIGDYDQVERIFTLDPNNQTQVISFFIQPVCKSQGFTIKSIYLRDRGGFVSNIDSAFLKYLDISYRTINTSCPANPDVDPPNLISFVVDNNVLDVGSANRNVTFTFVVEDMDSGIYLDKLPFIYLTGIQRIVKQKSTLISSTPTQATFKCKLTVPYGFGYPEFVAVSLYGIMDNNANFRGYSAYDLQNLGRNYVIGLDTSIFNPTSVLIEKTSDITTDGGELVIFGKGFGLDSNKIVVKLNFDDGSGYSYQASASFASATVLIIDVKPITKPFKVLVDKSSSLYVSNEYTVYPKRPPLRTPPYDPNPPSPSSSFSSQQTESSSSSELPPVTQAPNQCINDCGGSSQGYCSVTGCICYSPWMGIDCKSKVIIIPTPSINNTLPSTNISIPSQSTNEAIAYKGLISIVELQELNQYKELVYKYPFTQWIWSNISTDNEPVKYLYSTNITNQLDQSTTTVNVSIQYFDKDENIKFAGELLNMNQYSIKYSINITSYTFTNSLNQLQLIMKVSLESQKNQGCSALESGNTTVTNSEYVKLQVDDHSLYGRFVKRGIIDGRISAVTNQLLQHYDGESTQFNNIQSYIGINVRSYKRLVQLDPDFSVLVDQRPAADDTNAVCSSQKKKLSTAQLAGIIIGSVAFAAIVITSVTYYIVKKRKQENFERKLQNLNKD
ncbi:hypothetical protein CYY_005957 [Polysphondylium violaceum]|uniref:EGF-like domain-containing protein n=1 Tax=Polysphondylium violaceum TaxID=133409 RepID=A0A8J4PT11_9MYCE|nr:hypothetical protein CYY_005957 [Polysphondylium violaceum]